MEIERKIIIIKTIKQELPITTELNKSVSTSVYSQWMIPELRLHKNSPNCYWLRNLPLWMSWTKGHILYWASSLMPRIQRGCVSTCRGLQHVYTESLFEKSSCFASSTHLANLSTKHHPISRNSEHVELFHVSIQFIHWIWTIQYSIQYLSILVRETSILDR